MSDNRQFYPVKKTTVQTTSILPQTEKTPSKVTNTPTATCTQGDITPRSCQWAWLFEEKALKLLIARSRTRLPLLKPADYSVTSDFLFFVMSDTGVGIGGRGPREAQTRDGKFSQISVRFRYLWRHLCRHLLLA
ncbi:hypothetical protein PoB_000477500 [Plakobranchus ocellatus]|uniref:Uncharacterized protein n=1 Tax=Plakobranchus ocellatus TaxID=259542 RepID=A0AAV3Y656_9GAST|nr:hypothetical protein PoB_000477500 [Plakobranchus ocellatus]